MASPTKKRTLTEQKSSDVGDKNKSDVKDNNNNDSNADKIDSFRTFLKYLNLKADTEGKPYEYLQDDYENLEKELDSSSIPFSIPMDKILDRINFIFFAESTQTAMEDFRNSIEDIVNPESEEEEEEEDEDKRMEANAKKTLEYIKKGITEVKNAWNTEQYQEAFDKLFALTYVGLYEESWYRELHELAGDSGVKDKSNIEEIFQQISNQWTQMFSKSDKFLDAHLTLEDKHFIYALMDALHKRCEELGYRWTFNKPQSLAPKSLKWDTEQAKYNVPIKLIGDESEEDEEVEDSEIEEEEEEEEEDGQEEQEEEEPEGPPSKKRKL